jgi:hypothetical protein
MVGKFLGLGPKEKELNVCIAAVQITFHSHFFEICIPGIPVSENLEGHQRGAILVIIYFIIIL